MYPGSQLKKKNKGSVSRWSFPTAAQFTRSWQDRVLFSLSVRNSSRLTISDAHPTHAEYIRCTKMLQIIICKFNFHAHSTLYPVIGMKQRRSEACWHEVHPSCNKDLWKCKNSIHFHGKRWPYVPAVPPTNHSRLVRFVSALKKSTNQVIRVKKKRKKERKTFFPALCRYL